MPGSALAGRIEDVLRRLADEAMRTMHPFFHYVQIGGAGIGFNPWHAAAGITPQLPTEAAVVAHYDAVRAPYRRFVNADLRAIVAALDEHYRIDFTFFRSLWQSLYLFAAQGDRLDPARVARDLLQFVEWFRAEFDDRIGFPAPTPLFIGHAYPADVVDEHVDGFFDDLRVRLASFQHFFPGDTARRFPSSRFPARVTLLNAAITTATRHQTEYAAPIAGTDFFFRVRLGHTDCGHGISLTLSHLPFGCGAVAYGRTVRAPRRPPDLLAKCGGDYAADGSFRVKNIQGGLQLKPGFPAEAPLHVRRELLQSDLFGSLLHELRRRAIAVETRGSVEEIARLVPDDLNLFSVPIDVAPRAAQVVARWFDRHRPLLGDPDLRLVSDRRLTTLLRDQGDPGPPRSGFRLSRGDVVSAFRRAFPGASPFDLVLPKLLQIAVRASGFAVAGKPYRLGELRIVSAALNRWVGHARGPRERSQRLYDDQARRLGFRSDGAWYRATVRAGGASDDFLPPPDDPATAAARRALEAADFALYHDLERLTVPGWRFAPGAGQPVDRSRAGPTIVTS